MPCSDTGAKKLDSASDAKPEKNIARKMMLMAIDINKNYFRDMEEHDMDHDHDMNNMAHDSTKISDPERIKIKNIWTQVWKWILLNIC